MIIEDDTWGSMGELKHQTTNALSMNLGYKNNEHKFRAHRHPRAATYENVNKNVVDIMGHVQ